MFGFLKTMFEKDAQAAIERRARQLAPDKAPKRAAASAPARAPAPAQGQGRGQASDQAQAQAAADRGRAAAIAHMQSQVKEFVTPERQALIANAVAVHRAKQRILDDLDDESRAKLVAMAITTLLHQDTPSDKTKK